MGKSESGILSGYETTLITRAEMSETALKALQDRLKHVIASFSGGIVLTEDWGKRKMAYAIQKEERGHYTYMVYTGTGRVVQELERNLRLHEHVLRYLTVNLGRHFEPALFQEKRAEMQAAAQRREQEREARREERSAERRHYSDRGYGDDGYDGGSDNYDMGDD